MSTWTKERKNLGPGCLEGKQRAEARGIKMFPSTRSIVFVGQ